MEKRKCAVVQDLMVLYEDDVLQEESKKMVEEHIRECEDCRKIYERTKETLNVTDDITEKSEKEKENEAAQVMKKVSRKLTGMSVVIVSIACVVLAFIVALGNDICNRILNNDWGIVGMIYTIPTNKIEVTELYQLKNGDIYCTLKSDKEIGEQAYRDWQIPDNKFWEDTDGAVSEISFRHTTLWEWNIAGMYEVSAVFATERTGVKEDSGEEIVQRCSSIRYQGKGKTDQLIIWQRGQTVKEAPEEIERKAIAAYIDDKQIQKAIEECKNMGWDSDQILSEVLQQGNDISHVYGDSDEENEVTFKHTFNTVTIYNSLE